MCSHECRLNNYNAYWKGYYNTSNIVVVKRTAQKCIWILFYDLSLWIWSSSDLLWRISLISMAAVWLHFLSVPQGQSGGPLPQRHACSFPPEEFQHSNYRTRMKRGASMPLSWLVKASGGRSGRTRSNTMCMLIKIHICIKCLRKVSNSLSSHHKPRTKQSKLLILAVDLAKLPLSKGDPDNGQAAKWHQTI